MGLNQLMMTSFKSLEMGPSLNFYPNNTCILGIVRVNSAYIVGMYDGLLSKSKMAS